VDRVIGDQRRVRVPARRRGRRLPQAFAVLAAVLTVLAAVGPASAETREPPSASNVAVGSVAAPSGAVDPTVTIRNLDGSGKQMLRFTTDGDAVDAHDGMIAQFTYGGQTRYYWYGTVYDCGIGWLRTTLGGGHAPWCGFAVYSSDDLETWTAEGNIVSGEDPEWQQTCGVASCWRPKVVYNPHTQLFVAWADTLVGPSGYSAWTSPTPVGPWTFEGNPTVATNPGGWLVNQDESLFVDRDGTGYLVLTDANQGYRPTVEKLNDDYLSSTGERSAIPVNAAEAPSIVEHGGRYFMLVSYPNLGFGHTGTAYLWADDPVGTWTWGGVISDDTFGGQPTHAAEWQTTDGRSIYVFQADLWRRRQFPGSWGYPNQGLAGYNLSPLEFSDQNVPSLPVAPQWTENLRFVDTGASPALLPGSVHHAADGGDWYQSCDVRKGTSRSFTFVAPRSGVMTGLRVNVVRSEFPNADAQLELSEVGGADAPVLATTGIPRYGAGWSARGYLWRPDVQVRAGTTYRVVLRSDNTNTDYSCFGFVYESGGSGAGAASIAYGTAAWAPTNETVRFDMGIEDGVEGGETVTVAPRRLADVTVPGTYGTRVQVTGTSGVPAGEVRAAWLNVTVDHPSSAGDLVVYPADGTAGSVVQYAAGEVRAFSMLVRVGDDGDIRISSSATTRVVVDLTGWVSTPAATGPGRMVVLPAARRAVDTRVSGRTPGPRGVVHVPLADAGVPAGATAVLVDLTGAAPTADTYLAVYPTGSPWNGTSSQNLVADEVARSNRVLVEVGGDRSIDVLNHAGSTAVIIDVVGYVTAAGGDSGKVVPVDAVAATSVSGPVWGVRTFSADVGPLRAGSARPQAAAVLLQVEVSAAAAAGFLTVYPTGSGLPPTSDLNFPIGSRSTYNLVGMPVGPAAMVDAFTNVGVGTVTASLVGYVT
jgi:hypothetical protein